MDALSTSHTIHAIPRTVTINKIHQALQSEDILQKVVNNIESNHWTKQKDIESYFKLRYDLTIKNNLLLHTKTNYSYQQHFDQDFYIFLTINIKV